MLLILKLGCHEDVPWLRKQETYHDVHWMAYTNNISSYPHWNIFEITNTELQQTLTSFISYLIYFDDKTLIQKYRLTIILLVL